MKYVKKLIPIEISEPWLKLGDHPNVEKNELPQAFRITKCTKCGKLLNKHGWINTLEGGHIVCPGDRIVTGVKGEHYPIKPDIFEETYEPYNGQSEWKDKPDKTGWYWLKVLSKDKVWSLIENPVGITLENDKVKINTRAREDSTIIANSIDIRFIPIPKPNYLALPDSYDELTQEDIDNLPHKEWKDEDEDEDDD